MKTIKLFYFLLCTVFMLSLSSCESDDKITKEEANKDIVAEASRFLAGDIVLSTHATMNGVNKTLLKTGCPTKFNFKWSDADKQTFTISLLNFTVGAMPMVINFKCDVKTMQLNSWEKDEYKGSGWFKFYGTDGQTWGEDNEGSPAETKGSSIKGYFNSDTHEINFIVDYNMMNVRSECFLQTVDKSRINNFEKEFAQYEKDLAKYKEEHGL